MLSAIERFTSAFQFAIHRAFMREKLARWGKNAGGRILDVGAGDQPYRSCFPNATGYIATNTKRHYGTGNLPDQYTDVWIEDAAALPFEDGSFDHVVCFQVLSVIAAPEKFFAEAFRVLKPGGKLLLTTDFLYPSWSKEDKARYTIGQIRKFAQEQWMEVAATESFGGYRSLRYALYSRRLRGYPAHIKRAGNGFQKMTRGLNYLLMLAALPVTSATGWCYFLLEKKRITEDDFTFNFLLVAIKPAQ